MIQIPLKCYWILTANFKILIQIKYQNMNNCGNWKVNQLRIIVGMSTIYINQVGQVMKDLFDWVKLDQAYTFLL